MPRLAGRWCLSKDLPVLRNIVDIIIVILGVHTLLKFAFFLVLPYVRRRAALDRAYGNRSTATRLADIVLLIVAVVLAALLAFRGVKPQPFLVSPLPRRALLPLL